MGIVDAAAGLIGNYATIMATATQNKQQMKFSKEMYEKSRDDARYDAEIAHNRSLELQQNAFDETQRGREWQAGREDTQYQRQVNDAISAGLNPNVVSGVAPTASPAIATGGVGAQSDKGQIVAPKIQGYGFVQDAFNLLAERIFKEDNLKSQTEKNRADADKARAEAMTENVLRLKKAGLISAQEASEAAKSFMYDATASKYKAEVDMIDSNIKLNDARLGQIEADTSLKVEQKSEIISRIMRNESESAYLNAKTKNELDVVARHMEQQIMESWSREALNYETKEKLQADIAFMLAKREFMDWQKEIGNKNYSIAEKDFELRRKNLTSQVVSRHIHDATDIVNAGANLFKAIKGVSLSIDKSDKGKVNYEKYDYEDSARFGF